MLTREVFEEAVRRFGRGRGLWQRGSRILAAFSGGPDSLALLLALHAIREKEGFSLGCCTVNHHLRAEAEEEINFCASVAADLSIPFYRKDADVPAWRSLHGGSVETAARTLRYEALRSCAAAHGYDRIAAAHHKDDQAETVLYHLIRGSGMTGLRGMQPLAGDIVRPLLEHSRQDIEEYLSYFPYEPCHDRSNDVPDTARNQIRLQIMPLIRHINPRAADAMSRAAESLSEDEAFLMEKLQHPLEAIRWEDGRAAGNRESINHLPMALRRRLIRTLWQRLGAAVPSWEETERILHFLQEGQTGKWTSAAGAAVCIQYEEVLFQRGSTRKGLLWKNGAEWELLAERFDEKPLCGPDQILLDGDAAGIPRLRFLQEGDRFAPEGMEGTKKLSRLMNELHISRQARRLWPLAGDDHNIYWIGFLRQSRLARPTERTVHYLRLTLRRK